MEAYEILKTLAIILVAAEFFGLLARKCKASELFNDLKIYPQLLENVRVKSKPEAKADQDVIAAVEKVEKALGEDGRILIRESGTEPVIRVMVEAETTAQCENYVDEVIDVIRKKGHCE